VTFKDQNSNPSTRKVQATGSNSDSNRTCKRAQIKLGKNIRNWCHISPKNFLVQLAQQTGFVSGSTKKCNKNATLSST
jgi:hypothetical protein